MAQNTVLATGTTAATSTDVVIAAGAPVLVGIFADARLAPEATATLLIDTPGVDDVIAYLDSANPTRLLTGPGTYRVFRPQQGQALGVFTET